MMIVVMGVSGAGKTTIGHMLARRLGARFLEGDRFHPPANVAKMRAGLALDDRDRLPWLESLRSAIGKLASGRRPGVVACSALKRRYREILAADAPDAVFVHLRASSAAIRARLEARCDHFMPSSLLASQYADLEEPAPDERFIEIDAAGEPGAVLEAVVSALAELTSPTEWPR